MASASAAVPVFFPKSPSRGGVLYVHFPSAAEKDVVTLNGSQVPTTPCPPKWGKGVCALTGIAIDGTPDTMELAVDGTKPIAIPVRSKKYPVSPLKVDPAHVDVNPEDKKRMEEERAEVTTLYASSAINPLWKGKFILPGKGGTTSPFGSQRTFNGKVASTHYGLDLRGTEKTWALSSNAGRVVLAKELFNGGNMIIVDHGLGIFTSYSHLSSFAVKRGDLVEKGQRIGHVGSTGRVTGPHLHWAVRIRDLFVDPKEFLEVFNRVWAG